MHDASAVARLLVEFSRRLRLAGESPYRAQAYSRAAENLLTLTVPLADVIAQGRLREIPGIGAALAEVIRTLHQYGTTPRLEAMRADLPASLLEFLNIPGLAPEKIAHIHQQLGITTLADLEQACRQDRLKATKGLGAALQAKVLQGIELLHRSQGQHLVAPCRRAAPGRRGQPRGVSPGAAADRHCGRPPSRLRGGQCSGARG